MGVSLPDPIGQTLRDMRHGVRFSVNSLAFRRNGWKVLPSAIQSWDDQMADLEPHSP